MRGVFTGHYIVGEGAFQLVVPSVDGGFLVDIFGAERANKIAFQVFRQTVDMNRVLAREKDYLARRSGEPTLTDRACGMKISHATGMIIFRLDRYTSITIIAMVVINAETFTGSTYPTFVAVVGFCFLGIVV